MTPQMPFGVSLVGGAALAFAVYQMATKPCIHQLGSQLFTCVAMGGAAIAVLIHACISAWYTLEPWSQGLNGALIFWGAIIAVACTVLPSFLMSAAIAQVGPEAVAVVATLSPVCTIIMAVAILEEPFRWTDAVGTVMVVGGISVYGGLDRRTPRVA